MTHVWADERTAEHGYTAVDLLVAITVALSISALAFPLTAHTRDLSRVRQASAVVSAGLRLARIRAMATRRTTAVVFDQVAGRWLMRQCEDRNGNGVRRADIVSHTDTCSGSAVDLAQRFGVQVAVDPAIAGPEGSPSSPDPVRFGVSNMASCTPTGGCTPGTLYLRTGGGEQFAVRLGTMTGRARTLRYRHHLDQWVGE